MKINIDEIIDKSLKGEKTINPAENMEIAKAIVDEQIKKDLREEGILKDVIQKVIFVFYGMKDLARQVIEHQPFYYDSGKNWWYWDFNLKCWKLTDETDILNAIGNLSTANTVKSKDKNEILEALKQEARKNKPKPIKLTWIQFKDYIFDIETGIKHIPNPDYFTSNPIPYTLNVDNLEATPIMDKIFEEWVGKEHIQTLYEIIAYCLIPAYPIHRLFCLIGAGLNGKSCFLRLLEKFIGENNLCSTELDTLLSSRFEVTRLHKKLVCIMGETNFAELNKTSLIKKLTGGDIIGFEYKNKNPFEEHNYAKIIIATNNLPTTTDKSLGFYRRWLIIDFPNQFSEEKDILNDIPEEEYSCLALKCCTILHDLLKTRKFTNEGTIEERAKKYEDKSNFFDKFWSEYIQEDLESYITSKDFIKKITEFCRNNKQRMLGARDIAEKMGEKGVKQDMPYMEWYENDKQIKKRVRAWMGIKWQ